MLLTLLSSLALGATYLLVGIAIFLLNLAVYEWLTPFDVRREIFHVQNRALGHIVRGQILGQSIMISTIIYFLGVSEGHGFSVDIYLASLGDVCAFGIVGIFVFQAILLILSHTIPLEKEIIIDRNEALGSIVEALLIAVALLISVSLYTY